jgi:hypothetical protein
MRAHTLSLWIIAIAAFLAGAGTFVACGGSATTGIGFGRRRRYDRGRLRPAEGRGLRALRSDLHELRTVLLGRPMHGRQVRGAHQVTPPFSRQ